MLGARLSGLREAERVLNRMEEIDHLAVELSNISHQSLSALKTMTNKARFLSISPSTPASQSPTLTLPKELSFHHVSFTKQDEHTHSGLNKRPSSLIIPYSRVTNSQKLPHQIVQPILVKAKITDLPI